jgi:hypothetical protein
MLAFVLAGPALLPAPQPVAFAQTTISTGSIQGTISDPSGGVVPGASIEVTSQATGRASHFTSGCAGTWDSGPLLPGDYLVRVSAPGFRTPGRASRPFFVPQFSSCPLDGSVGVL